MTTYAYVGLLGAAVRLLLGGVFLVSGGLKLGRWTAYEPIFNALRFSAKAPRNLALQILAIVEIVLGAWIFIGEWVIPALLAAILVLSGFTLVLFVLHRRGYKGACACFGSVDRYSIGRVHIARNLILMLAAAITVGMSFIFTSIQLPVWSLPPLALAVAVVLLILAIIVYVLALEMEDFLTRSGQ